MSGNFVNSTKNNVLEFSRNVGLKSIRKTVICFLTLFVFYGNSFGQITSLNAWTSVYHGTANMSAAYTIPLGSNARRVLVVGVASSTSVVGARTVAITYGGQTLTPINGDLSTATTRVHSQLYYLNEAGIDAAVGTTLAVNFSLGTTVVNDVFATVLDNVNQITITTDSHNYNSINVAVNPIVFATGMTINANDFSLEVISTLRSGNTNYRTYSGAANWTVINAQQYQVGDGVDNAVLTRTIPIIATTDVSSTALSGSAISSMTSVSFKASKYFRSIANGNWNATTTWEQSYDNSTNWVAATSTPTSSDNGVTIQSGNTVTLTTDATASALTFVNGRIVTGPNTLSLTNTATVTGAGAGNYVYGNLQKGIATNTTTKTFEIGDATNYTPVTIAFSGTATNGTGSITASTTFGDHPYIPSSSIDPSLSVNRYWTLTNSGVTFGTYSATFTFVPTDLDVSADASTFIVGRFTKLPNTWSYPSIGTRNATSTQITGLTQFGDFQIGNTANFSATVQNSSCPLVKDGAIYVNSQALAVNFNNADNGFIDLGKTMLSNLSKFTVEGWINFNQLDNPIGRTGGFFGQNDAIEFGMIDTNNIQLWSAGGGTLNVNISSYPPDNAWHHVAGVGDGTNMYIYIDGVLKGSQAATIANYGASTFSTKIGGGIWDATGEEFTGLIRKVGFWNVALTPAQILTLATSPTVYTGTEPGLIAGYNFFEGAGTTISSLPVGSSGTFTAGTPTPAWVNPFTYSWNTSPVTTNRNVSPVLMGTYTLTVTNTQNSTSKTYNFTVNSDNKCATNWVGTNNTTWGDKTNWDAQYVPATGKDVQFAATPVNDLQLDQDRTIGRLINNSAKRLVIPPALCLTLNDTILSNDVVGDKIYIQSSSSPLVANGSLIFHNKTTKVYGTVEMYSMASKSGTADSYGNFYKWQFFGIPLRSIAANPTFAGSYIRTYDESKSQATHWISLSNSSTLTSFLGYEITQVLAKTLFFQGILENGDLPPVTLIVSPSPAAFPGQHIFANPYTAAIDIKKLTFGTYADSTVYLFNTGSFGDWNSQKVGTSQLASNRIPGQYTSVSQGTAGNLGIPRQIPSMQAFFVRPNPKVKPISILATFAITYNSVVTKNTDAQRVKAENDSTSATAIGMRIDLTSTNYSDQMWLFSNPKCTHSFDNGWDGFKMVGNALSPQIYSVESDGNYQVNAVDDMNNTEIAFQAGQDVDYTMTFTHNNIISKYAGVYLMDLVENKTVDVTANGSTYSFVAQTTPTATTRFKIITRNYEKNSPDAETQIKVFNSGSTVFVQNLSSLNGEMVVYDLMGHYLKKVTFGPNTIAAFPLGFRTGAYVVNASTSSERVGKRLILNN